jgi:hypothetical protein
MTPEEIAKHYAAMLYSIDSIKEGMDTGDKDEETLDFVQRNVTHLETMVAKDWWTTEDMTAVNQAIADGNAYLGV